MARTTAADFFDTATNFEDLILRANENVRGDVESKFVEEMSDRCDEYGLATFISKAQVDWLRQIADR